MSVHPNAFPNTNQEIHSYMTSSVHYWLDPDEKNVVLLHKLSNTTMAIPIDHYSLDTLNIDK